MNTDIYIFEHQVTLTDCLDCPRAGPRPGPDPNVRVQVQTQVDLDPNSRSRYS